MKFMSFRKLSPEEEAKFRASSRVGYETFTPIDGLWHPVCQDECVKMNMEAAQFVEEERDPS